MNVVFNCFEFILKLLDGLVDILVFRVFAHFLLQIRQVILYFSDSQNALVGLRHLVPNFHQKVELGLKISRCRR